MLNLIANTIDWMKAHPILATITIYLSLCLIDLFVPLATNRGSWWNILSWMLRTICLIGG